MPRLVANDKGRGKGERGKGKGSRDSQVVQRDANGQVIRDRERNNRREPNSTDVVNYGGSNQHQQHQRDGLL